MVRACVCVDCLVTYRASSHLATCPLHHPTLQNYVQMLDARTRAFLPDWSPRFITDTGRNGVSGVLRQSCANWCNIRGAGLGREPTTSTSLPGLLDAYYWYTPSA